jgi:hypothetical protein
VKLVDPMTDYELDDGYLEDTADTLDEFEDAVHNESGQNIYKLGSIAEEAKNQVSKIYDARDEVGYDQLPEEAQELISQFQSTRRQVRNDPDLPNTLENKSTPVGVFVHRKLSEGAS